MFSWVVLQIWVRLSDFLWFLMCLQLASGSAAGWLTKMWSCSSCCEELGSFISRWCCPLSKHQSTSAFNSICLILHLLMTHWSKQALWPVELNGEWRKRLCLFIKKEQKMWVFFTVHYMIVITFKDCKYSCFQMSESVKKKKRWICSLWG